ncbi:hypothetical protein B9Z55_011212 [Caenorhabditis nigoni]|uniref:F-box domain-containing protein n=1 Tax=Caenorhabditis nigoni TaxID=1611254 RepID=A0A2G5UJ31_9PELO|nr:hypothetical protein B9Z55_011212 [Caenorhabditis nigoni]
MEEVQEEVKKVKEFRLLDLPFVIFRKVLHEFEFFTVLNLTYVSKKTKQQVRLCALNAKDVELYLTKDYERVFNVVYKGIKCSWGNIETKNAEAEGAVTRPLDDKIFKPVCSQILFILHKKSVDTFRFDRSITEDDVTEYWGMVEDVKDIYIGSELVTTDELTLIFKKFQKLENFYVEPEVPRDFKGLEHRKLEVLYLESTRSMMLPSLGKFESNILLMENSRMELWELNVFIKNWIKSAPRINEPSVIRIFGMQIDASILREIQIYPWNPKHRSSSYVVWLNNGIMSIDCSEGHDIYRKSDGMMATVLLINNTFNFFIWTQRFHKIPHGSIMC